MEDYETVKVKNFKKGSKLPYLVINVRDYDPQIHEAVDSQKRKELSQNMPAREIFGQSIREPEKQARVRRKIEPKANSTEDEDKTENPGDEDEKTKRTTEKKGK